MFDKLLGFIGSRSGKQAPPPANITGPYSNSHTNLIYQMLFCDNASLFRAQPGVQPPPWQDILLGSKPDPAAVRGIAEDQTTESRVRMLAFNWLRQNGQEVPKGELLGVIIEIGLERGLDVLAVYADLRVRYINQTGKLAIFEAAPAEVGVQASKVLAEARQVITKIGPWDRPRLPHPPKGAIRMTFLVSNGLYFGQGPWPGMSRDPVAAALISESAYLLRSVVNAAFPADHPKPEP
jgi:hypothetical protein